MAPVRGIVFDFDDTLVHSTYAYAQALREVDVDPNGAAYAEARRLVKARLGPGSPQSHHRLLYFKALWPKASPTHLLNISQRYEEALMRHVGDSFRQLQRPTLLQALKKKFRCCILTNETTRTQLLKWRACDPDGVLFEGLVCSEEVGVEKPHPAMFRRACELLQLPYDACLMVGDSNTNDILPARQLGMQALRVNEFGAPTPQQASVAPDCLPSLASLVTHLS